MLNMPLIAQALVTMESVRSYLSLYTLTAVTSTETLTADTAATTFSFAHTDLAPNLFGTFYQLATATAVATAANTLLTANMTIAYDLGTTTFTATITGVVTISSYSYFAWDYSKDKQIERLINSMSSWVSKYTNRKFIKDTYSEFYKGSGRQRLVLNQYPVNTITSVKVDSASYTAGTDYVTSDSTYLEQGIVFRNTGWTWYGYLTGLVGELTAPVDNIGVVYSAGYTLEPESAKTLPWDIENAILSMIADAYGEQQDGTVGLKQLTQGKLTYVWDNDQLVKQYSGILDSYKKVIF